MTLNKGKDYDRTPIKGCVMVTFFSMSLGVNIAVMSIYTQSEVYLERSIVMRLYTQSQATFCISCYGN